MTRPHAMRQLVAKNTSGAAPVGPIPWPTPSYGTRLSPSTSTHQYPTTLDQLADHDTALQRHPEWRPRPRDLSTELAPELDEPAEFCHCPKREARTTHAEDCVVVRTWVALDDVIARTAERLTEVPNG